MLHGTTRSVSSKRLAFCRVVLSTTLGIFAVAGPNIVPSALCQSNAVDGAIDGYVQAPDGGALVSASITLRNHDTGVELMAQSDSKGYYRFSLLPVGSYDLTITSSGFAALRRSGITVSVGSSIRLNLSLSLASNTAEVTVTADASILDTHSPAIGATLSQEVIEDLPDVTRNVYNLFLFSPGIKGVPSTGFGTPTLSFGGVQRTQWNVDGQDNTSRQFTSNIRLVVNTPETLQGSQVLSNGYSAEFGRSAGGQVNLFTRAGTNTYHGQLLGFVRPPAIQAIKGPVASGATPTVPDQSWYDVAATLGGPIVRNRLFFFVNYEHNPYIIPTASTVQPANAAILGLPAEYTNPVPTGQTYNTPSGRLDFNLGKANSGFVRYMRFTNNQRYSGAGGLSVLSRGLNFHDTQNGSEAQLVTVISPTALNEFRFGEIQRDQLYVNEVPPNATDVNINISGIANFGNSATNGSHNFEQDYQVIDNLTKGAGLHTFKVGVDLETTRYFVHSAQAATYTFQNLAQYQNTLAGKGTYFQLSLALGNPELEQRYFFYNAFAQDEFRVSPRLTLSYGLRYQYVQVPELDLNATLLNSRYARTDKLDIAPRFAFTAMPFRNGTTAIRGSYGIYFDTPSLSFFQSAAQTNGDPNRLTSYTISGSAVGAPLFPTIPTTAAASFATKPNIVTFDPNFRIMYSHQANLQIDQQMTKDLALTIQYNMLLSRFGAYERDTNLAAPTSYLADGRPVFGGTRPNTQFTEVLQLSSGSNTNYHALDVTVTKRISHGLQFGTTYSYSKALGTGDQIGAAITDPSDLSRDYGRLSADLRHYWTFQGTYRAAGFGQFAKPLNGIVLSTMTWVHSGYPINSYVGSDLNKDSNANDRPLFISRNSANGPHFYQVDFRVAKEVKIFDRYHLELRAEAQDVLNHQNADCNATSGCSSAIQNNTATSTYLNIQTARIPRQIQFGGRLFF